MLQKLPRIPTSIIDNLVDRFALLSHILRASIEELDEVEGIGEVELDRLKMGLRECKSSYY